MRWFCFWVGVLLCSAVSVAAEDSRERYLIHLRTFDERNVRSIEESGGRIVHRFPSDRIVSAWLDASSAAKLKASARIEKIEPDPKRYLHSQTTPYGISMVQADRLDDSAAANRTLCIVDSGYNMAHADLQDKPVAGVTLDSTETPLRDVCGHGTHVAGTVAALTNDIGVRGVLSHGKIKLYIVKLYGIGNDCSLTFSSDLVASLQACRAAGANVINMSLGGPTATDFERTAFQQAFDAGVLVVASAGNEDQAGYRYPASYDSVISVGAIDSNKVVADFSQKNDQVELAAPGVSVLSTVPYKEISTVRADGILYSGGWIENAKRSPGVSGNLVYGGLCANPNKAWKGKVVLCKRGTFFFIRKVTSVQKSGGVAAVIFNNVPGPFNGTLGEGETSNIPAISISQEDGQTLLENSRGSTARVISKRLQPASGFDFYNGTSMAAPHVAGVAALIWSYNPSWSNVAIRNALQVTAEDLGPAGKDNSYGYGLIRAEAALNFLQASR